jgi:hypothetical protein
VRKARKKGRWVRGVGLLLWERVGVRCEAYGPLQSSQPSLSIGTSFS